MRQCPHAPRPFRACEHLLFPPPGGDDLEYRLLFAGAEVTPACPACADGTPALAECCDACRLPFFRTDTFGMFDGFGGTKPEPRTREAGLTLVQETVDVRDAVGERLQAITPIPASSGRAAWLGLTESWRLVTLELPSGRVLAELPPIPAERLARPVLDEHNPHRNPHPRLVVSPDGQWAAVLMERRRDGVLIELATGAMRLALDRLDYHPDVSGWPFAFFERDGKMLAIHAIDWNRLAVTDLVSGDRLAAEEEKKGEDYFLGPITVSERGSFLATAGWVWQPVGILRVDPVDALLSGRRSRQNGTTYLNQSGYHWNGPNVWLDDTRLLVWGIGDDDQRMVDGAIVHDVRTSAIAGWWPAIPYGDFALDRASGHLWCCAGDTTVWDVATGERIAQLAVATDGFHPSARHAAGLTPEGRISLAFLQRA